MLRAVLPKYPQVRLVFKDFPLETIHPWAMSASITGRCVLQQSSDAFWKYHDAVYDNQDVISPENAYNKLLEFAVQAGATEDKLKPCIADPKTQDLVAKKIQQHNIHYQPPLVKGKIAFICRSILPPSSDGRGGCERSHSSANSALCSRHRAATDLVPAVEFARDRLHEGSNQA